MKQIVLMIAVVALVGCGGKKPLTKEESANLIEAAIRKAVIPRTTQSELTKADLDKVTELHLHDNQLTSVKGLGKLTQLRVLFLHDNPDLTKAQIDELKKALPKCEIYSDY